MSEIERIKDAYSERKRRDEAREKKIYAFSPGELFFLQQREKAVLELLYGLGIYDLSEKVVLDIGCGHGNVLRDFVRYGAVPGNLYGVDLLPDRIDFARTYSPDINFQWGNVEKLPFGDAFFDMVICFTVFTSILDRWLWEKTAGEMMRVLKPGGLILWHDFFRDNPFNRNVRGVPKREIFKLFPGCEIKLRRFVLVPQLTRLVAPYSFILCYLLEKIPFLCVHYLASILKK